MKQGGWALTAILVLATGLGVSPAAALEAGRSGNHAAPAPAGLEAAYGRLPLAFEANQGQTDGRVQFLARGSGYSLFLTSDEAVLALRRSGDGTTLRMTVVGARRGARGTGIEALPGRSHYLIGREPAKWRTNVPTYARVEYRDLYPGVSLTYYGTQRELEYDFVVAPGADPGQITLAFEGAERVELDDQGNLVLHTPRGALVSRAPLIYQEVGGVRRPVAGGYRLEGARRVGFRVAAYDRSRPLVIDPVLGYSTYLGKAGGENGAAVAVDAFGNAYITGVTTSTDFPVSGTAFQGAFAGAASSGGGDAFVAMVNAAGSALGFATYLGGSGDDVAQAIAVDGSGNVYVAGQTTSSDFPTQNPIQAALAGPSDAFVTKLDPAGSALVYSTYLGGSGDETAYALALDAARNAYVTGTTSSTNFPTQSPIQAALNGPADAFVTKVNTAGSALVYSTYLGGGDAEIGFGIAVDGSSNAYVTGVSYSSDFPTTTGAYQTSFGGARDAFVTKLDAAGSAHLYSTYLGGTGTDEGHAIAVDASGNAYLTGFTTSAGFPTLGAYQAVKGLFADAFVAKLDPTQTGAAGLVYSTFLGGNDDDFGLGIAVDSAGNAYVVGSTRSSTFPTKSAVQSANAGSSDAFAAKLDPAQSGAASLIYATYLGGSGFDGVHGDAYVVGVTDSSNFPTTAGAYQTTFGGALASGFGDAFLARVNAADAATAAAGQTTSVSTAPGVAGQAGVAATLTNTGGADATVSAETLTTNPGTTTGIINVGGGYVDLKVTGADTADSLTARFYYPSTVTGATEASLTLLYFDGTAWVAVKGSGGAAPAKDTSNDLDGTVSGGRFTVTFDNTSTPRLVDMTGTVFTAALVPVTALSVAIDIKPGSLPNSINPRSRGKIPVAVLSSATFNAPTEVDRASLTFGRTGNEASLASCNAGGQDVNGDGRLDLVCHFDTQQAAFQAGDTQGTLKGQTIGGTAIMGSDSVRIVP